MSQLRRSVLIVALVVCVALRAAAQAPQLRVTEVVVAFGALQHAALAYSQITVCAVPGLAGSCSPLVSADGARMVGNEVMALQKELATNPSAWQQFAGTYLGKIVAQLAPADQARLAPYVTLVRTVITG